MNLYTDYRLSNFGQVTATNLSNLLDGRLSHDKIIRFLSGQEYCSKYLWIVVNPLVRLHESEDACLIVDDTNISKPYTDENDLICCHWYYSKNRNEKGISLLTVFYHILSPTESEPLRIPVSFECVKKRLFVTAIRKQLNEIKNYNTA